VILISIDTLRADHLSCYGYTLLKTPHIDSLANGGTVFTSINSQVPITLPSHASLFTSTYPFATGIRENAQVVPPGAVTLATALAARGYNTAAFIGGYFLEQRFGLAQGFQTYDSPFDTRIIEGALDLKRSAPQVIAGAERWLEHNSGSPFFLFVHLFDLHQPYDAPDSYRSRAPQSQYDQELAYVDDCLGGFLEFLARSGLDRRALVVLFSDHGESLGDHGETTHGYFIYRSTLHVPLIFHWPSAAENRNSKVGTGNSAQVSSFDFRVSSSAGLIDVAPTILSFLGIPSPPSFCGHSLLELAKSGSPPERDVYSESYYVHDKFGWAGLRSLRRGDYQYIDAPHPELYDLKQDPAELHNLLPGQTALGAAYRERLATLMGTYHAPPSEGGALATAAVPHAGENLRSLGYLEITSPHPALDDSGIDPKDRLFEYRRYLMAGHLARIGKAQEAVAEYQAILADDPRNLPAYIELARSDMGLHQYLDGANQLQAALKLDPHNVEAEELLGDVWLAVGNLGHAAAEFYQLLTFAPKDYEAHFGLGLVAARRGRTEEAADHFRAALAANPHSAEAHYQLGLILAGENQKEAAAREFNAALQENPKFQDARRELEKLPQPGH
jgi:arylsulfatase A-like enzyme/Tfp pilus assembly protein PilF